MRKNRSGRFRKEMAEKLEPLTSETPAQVIQLAPVEGELVNGFVMPEADPSWHHMATMLWEAAKRSGQSMFYEPSDWANLYILCESVSRDFGDIFLGFNPVTGEELYGPAPLKGASLSAYSKIMADLMMTEGSRRRMRIEFNRDRREEEKLQQKKLDIVQDRKALLS